MTDLPEALPTPTISGSPGAVQVVGSSNVHIWVQSGGRRWQLPLSSAVVPLAPSVASPARILRADSGVLPFLDRGGLLEQVWSWVAGPRFFAGCVIGGSAGTGKTRLGVEISERARGAGWVTGLLTEHPSDAELETLVGLQAKRMIIVDYAELTAKLLETLVPHLAYAATKEAPVRIVLLVRTRRGDSDDWRETLHGPRRHGLANFLDTMPVWSLNDQPLDAAERRELFRRSVADLSQRADRTASPAVLEAVDVDRFTDPLSIVIAAYLATHDPAAAVPRTRESLLDTLIDNHERAYWTVTERHPTAQASERTQEGVIALASLTTARTRTEAIDLLRLLPELSDSGTERRAALADWAASLYPTDGFWGSLQPDALGERLIARCFADQHDLLAHVVSGDDHEALIRPLHVFARLGLNDDPLREHLGRLVSARLQHLCALAAEHADKPSHNESAEETFGTETLVTGLNQAVSTLPLKATDIENARAVLDATAPNQTLVSLQLSLAAASANLVRDADGDESGQQVARLAGALIAQAIALGRLGRHEEALATVSPAVGHYRTLSAARPDVYLPDLVSALNELSAVLDALGRATDAFRVTQEAVAHSQMLADAHPDTAPRALAMAWNNQANALAALGSHEDALEIFNNAITHFRGLITGRPDGHLHDFASALNNRSTVQQRLGRYEDALEALEEAVISYRLLVAARPDAYLPDLAMALNNQSVVLERLGLLDEARRTTDEAVEAFRSLATARPDAYLPDLAMALNNQSVILERQGSFVDAVTASNDSVVIRRTLATARPDAYRADLASALHNQSTVLDRLGRLEEALQAINEAVALFRVLDAERPDVYRSDLASALHNQSTVFDRLGLLEDALAASSEATAIYRPLAAALPGAHRPSLASALQYQSTILNRLRYHEQALELLQEAVAVYRTLVAKRPDTYRPDLAATLNFQAATLARLGRRKRALEAISEVVALYRIFADANPELYGAALEAAQHNRSNLLRRDEG